MVMRLPSRRRCTSLPSLTARRPNVVSAMSAWRQNSVIWLRIWSFFMRPGWGPGFGKHLWAARDRAAVLSSSAHRGNAPLAGRSHKQLRRPGAIRDGDGEHDPRSPADGAGNPADWPLDDQEVLGGQGGVGRDGRELDGRGGAAAIGIVGH